MLVKRLFSVAAQRPLLATTLGLTAIAATVPRFNLGSALSSRSSSSSRMASDANRSVSKSEDEWRAQLSKEQFRVLRQQGTEMAGTGEYDRFQPDEGVFTCAGCGTPLYTAKTKFKSGCGWPAFYQGIDGAIETHTDRTFGMERIEIVCKACGGHLGHVFKGEGYGDKTTNPDDTRHCVNSVSLSFKPANDDAEPRAKA